MQFSTEMHHKYAYVLYMNCFVRVLAVTNMATVRIFELMSEICNAFTGVG